MKSLTIALIALALVAATYGRPAGDKEEEVKASTEAAISPEMTEKFKGMWEKVEQTFMKIDEIWTEKDGEDKKYKKPEDKKEVIENLKKGWDLFKDLWLDLKGQAESELEKGTIDIEKLREKVEAVVKDATEKVEKATVESVTKDVKEKFKSDVKTEDLKKFFVDANEALGKQVDIAAEIKPYLDAFPDVLKLIEDEVVAQKEPMMKAIENLGLLWDEYKGKITEFKVNPQEGLKVIVDRIMQANAAFGEVWKQKKDDIILVIDGLVEMIPKIIVRIEGVKTETVTNAIFTLIKGWKECCEGPAKEIFEKFEAVGERIGKEMEQMFSGEAQSFNIEKLTKDPKIMQEFAKIMPMLQQQEYVPHMMKLMAPLQSLYKSIEGKVNDITAIMDAADAAKSA